MWPNIYNDYPKLSQFYINHWLKTVRIKDSCKLLWSVLCGKKQNCVAPTMGLHCEKTCLTTCVTSDGYCQTVHPVPVWSALFAWSINGPDILYHKNWWHYHTDLSHRLILSYTGQWFLKTGFLKTQDTFWISFSYHGPVKIWTSTWALLCSSKGHSWK